MVSKVNLVMDIVSKLLEKTDSDRCLYPQDNKIITIVILNFKFDITQHSHTLARPPTARLVEASVLGANAGECSTAFIEI